MNDVLALVVPESSTVSLPGFRYSIHRFRLERSDRLNHLIVPTPFSAQMATDWSPLNMVGDAKPPPKLAFRLPKERTFHCFEIRSNSASAAPRAIFF